MRACINIRVRALSLRASRRRPEFVVRYFDSSISLPRILDSFTTFHAKLADVPIDLRTRECKRHKHRRNKERG